MTGIPKVIINGEFLCIRLTGIERFALEVTKRLDNLCEKNEIGIIIAKNAKAVPDFHNIKIIPYHKDIKSFPVWQQFIFPGILWKHGAQPLHFGNTGSLFAPGISFLHDIYCELFPGDFKTPREKIQRLYNMLLYRIVAYGAKKIATVSNYSKNQIAKQFHINQNKISVIYSSWNHFSTIKADYSVLEETPALARPFYFSLGSLSRRKNIKWIIDFAAKHTDELFALSGVSLNTLTSDELSGEVSPNVLFLGYLDDGKVKALMEKCRAFILPSYYEGFGLTPLEALSAGAKIIVANAASLPEIYGGTAHYIDPFDISVNLEKLLEEPVEKPDDILLKYSYDTAAEKVYALIRGYTVIT
jgi:glycosyltransferase involved in cell wall biosynthesis